MGAHQQRRGVALGQDAWACIQDLKVDLTHSPVLAYYNHEKLVSLQVDASSHGLGGCVMQDGRPVANVSRSMNSSENHYAQLEKEMLVITWGLPGSMVKYMGNVKQWYKQTTNHWINSSRNLWHRHNHICCASRSVIARLYRNLEERCSSLICEVEHPWVNQSHRKMSTKSKSVTRCQ